MHVAIINVVFDEDIWRRCDPNSLVESWVLITILVNESTASHILHCRWSLIQECFVTMRFEWMSCSLCFQPLDKDEPQFLLRYVTTGCSVVVEKDLLCLDVCFSGRPYDP